MSSTVSAIPFWFLRHGETDWNAQGLAQGNVEIPLNANGIAQAQTAAGLLRHRGIASIVCSPMGRARHTARIVSETLGLPEAEVEPELHETSFGERDGQPMEGAWFGEWIAGHVTPPNAERFADLRVRATRAVNRALQRPAPVLVVAHGALFRALRAEMGLPPDVRLANAIPVFCTPGTPWQLEMPQTP